MTEGNIFWSLRGRQFKLGPPVEGGGDGVFSLPLSRQIVARIHEKGADLEVWDRKIRAMVKRPPNLPDIVEDGERFVRIAWPGASLHNKLGQYAGYVMPAVDLESTSALECVLQERQARAQGLPTSLGAKIILAARVAVALTELHEKGHRLVYLTPANLRFHRQSLHLAVVDCERFGILGTNERFAVDHGAAERNAAHYLAPEFQNKKVPRDNEESQDRFALAVLVFQLLNFGIHPFTGIPTSDQVPTDIPGRIAKNLFAYGSAPCPHLKPSPGSGHQAMPKQLKSLFHRAFAGKATERPQAQEWATWLQFYAIPTNNCVVVCSTNSRHNHYADLPCAACARAPLLPGVESDTDSPPKSAPAIPEKPPASPFEQPERAYQPARHSPSATMPEPNERPERREQPDRRAQTEQTDEAEEADEPQKPSLPVSPLEALKSVVALTVVALVVRFCLSFLDSPTPDMKTVVVHDSVPEPVESPVRPTFSAASVTDPYLAGFPAMGQDEALTDGYVIAATLAIAADDRPEWQRAITNLHTDVPAHAAPAPNEFQTDFSSFSAGLSPDNFNEGKRQELLNKLRQVLKKNLYDDEAAYELGWLNLVGGQRDEARSLFLHAIWVNPDRAAAWYGLGVIGAGDNQMTGALATAELLTTDPAQAQSMRNAFPPLLLRLMSVNPDHFAALEVKARHMADQYRPLVAPAVYASPASSAAASPK